MTYTPLYPSPRAVGRAALRFALLLAAALLPLLLLTVALSAVAPSASAGPIILSGHDPEDHGTPGDEMQFDILEFVVSRSTRSASPSMILMLGGSTTLGTELQAIVAPLGYTVMQVQGTAIETVDFDPFDAIYMPTTNNEVTGGMTPAEVASVNTRSADIQTFVNEGGGLAAFSQNVSGGYGWFPLGGLMTSNLGAGTGSALTPIGMMILRPSATAVEPFHTSFDGPAGFFGLDVLAFQVSTGRALIIGGDENTQIMGQLTLSPDSASNPVGTPHTVTASLVDQDSMALAGETILFEVLSGPNVGDTGGDVTDGNGNASFTYVGDGGEGTDRIRASWDDGTSIITSNIVTKVWTAGGPGGNVVAEVGDAGNIVSQPAQNAQGLAVDQITGTLLDVRLDEDCYFFTVTDPDNFSAEVVAFDGDSQLFLFDEDRNGIYGDDDGGMGTLSFISPSAFDAGGGTAGDYYLCITAWSNDPENAEMAEIFPDGSGTPDPDEGDAVLTSWNRETFGSGSADYDIRITGVDDAMPAVGYDLSVVPLSPLVVSPGGHVRFQYTATNNTPAPVSGGVRAVVKPDGMGGALLNEQIVSGTLQSGESFTGTFVQQVPVSALPDTYVYAIVARDSSRIVDSEVFSVVVEGTSVRLAEALAALRALRFETEETGDKTVFLAARTAYLADASNGWSVVEGTMGEAAASTAGDGTSTPTKVKTYPNPFVSQTRISFTLDQSTEVWLVVYDALGREIAMLADETLDAGVHSVAFDASRLPSGVYLWRLDAGSRVQNGRLTLLK